MNRVAQYLQQHLDGEVMTSADARNYFSTDASIFKVVPQIVIYPRSEADLRKIAKFSWQLAERGRNIPITARGLGTDFNGASLGSGLMVNFTAHLSKLLTLDPNKGITTVQPGINYGALQQIMMTHGHYFPSAPSSADYSTIGGAVANNASGRRSVKYGQTKEFVNGLRVVLANGEVIETGLLNKKMLNKKKGLATLEGEIYRTLDSIITDNSQLLEQTKPLLASNNSGYDIWSVKDSKGNFDLTKLLVGSQGTLGILSEITLEAELFNPTNSLVISYFDSLDKVSEAIPQIKSLEPSSIEMIDSNLLDFLDATSPNHLNKIIKKPHPKVILLTEFDDPSPRKQKKKVKKIFKMLEGKALKNIVTNDQFDQEDYWKMRDSAAAVMWQSVDAKKPLPIIGDAVVPTEKINEYLVHFYRLCDEFGIDKSVWGHASDGNIQNMPKFDLSQLGDRQKIFKLMNDYFKLVMDLGGNISGQYNDGRLRGPFLELAYGTQLYDIFKAIKQLFDPYDMLNPGVKVGVNMATIQKLVRPDYDMAHFYNYMPRT
jgi:FAD/FMN-containing dehydrogenase